MICVIQKYCAIAYFIQYLHVLCQKLWIKDVQSINTTLYVSLQLREKHINYNLQKTGELSCFFAKKIDEIDRVITEPRCVA